jgi:hypothetical protein
MMLNCLAGLLVAALPLRVWRSSIGGRPGDREDPALARRLAAQVERAAWRLPFAVKCLPQALALSWLLRRRHIAHRVVLAVRPSAARGGNDDLHAWVDCQRVIVLGGLPGPWAEIHVLGSAQ